MVSRIYLTKVKKYKKVKNKPKVAVCFFGHLRTYKQSGPLFMNNFANYYDCDMFMHCWSKLDHNTKTWHNFSSIIGDTDIENVKEYYDLKKYIIEEQIYEDLGIYGRISIFGIKSMMHSMKASFNLALEYANLNNVNYDYVLMIRPDIGLMTPLVFEEILLDPADLNSSIVSIQSGEYINKKGLNACDTLFYSKMPTLEKLFRNTGNIVEWAQNTKPIKGNVEECFEHLFDIEDIKHKYLMDYEFLSDWIIIRVGEKREHA